MISNASLASIGGGPAGLMAAETLASAGMSVTLYERMPTLARKFLMAGRGGLNITHSEPLDVFLTRYGAAAPKLEHAIRDFSPDQLRAWCGELGEPTFIGSSGRVFPKSLKASPLLRAWLRRLEKQGVQFAMRHEWKGWNEKNELVFVRDDASTISVKTDAVLLALGGASWPRLGADGSWLSYFSDTEITPFQPANCGFHVAWSDVFASRFAGEPLKTIAASINGHHVAGEAMITRAGIEGGLIYALSSMLREIINSHGHADLLLDLRPTLSHAEITARLAEPRGKASLSTYLKRVLNLSSVQIGLVQEALHQKEVESGNLAMLIKAYPLRLTAPFTLERAISSAGGVRFDALTPDFMLKSRAGVFLAGEMLDWEAPTGGYLLQASISSGRSAAQALLRCLAENR